MSATGTRREARERAVELLYEAEAKGVEPHDVVAGLPLPPDPYAVALAFGVADHQIEIDSVLDRFARSWPVSRMAAMDRMVLRLGVLELATETEVPRGVCLSEAVELGGRYGSTDDTSRFVNGVLASVADEVRDGPRPWMPVEAVVFDMDGVIRHWTAANVRAFEEAHGLPPQAIAQAAFAQPLFDEAMLGVHAAEEWARRIGVAVNEVHPSVGIEDCRDAWLSADWELDDAIVTMAAGLRDAGTRVALFSNASTRLGEDLAAMGLADAFDVIGNSSLLGRMKPDPAGFAAVGELVDVAPERILFVDDNAANVAGAVAAGWHSVLMRGAGRFADVLRRLRVPGAPPV